MSDYAPLRDAFQELNRMMIDNDRWQQEHDVRKSELGLRQLQVETALEDSKLNRVEKQLKAKRAEDAMSVVPLNVFDIVPNNNYTRDKLFNASSGAQDFARRVAGRDDVSVDPITGIVRQANGEVVSMEKFKVQQRVAGAISLLDSHLDPEEMLNVNLNSIVQRQAALEKELKSVPVTDVARRRDLKEQLAEVTKTRNQHSAKLEPEELEPLYRQRASFYQKMMLQAASGNADEQTLAAYKLASDSASDSWKLIFGKMVDKQTRLETARLKNSETSHLKTQQHNAILRDKEGNIVEEVIVNVPKTGVASAKPEELDPRLKGFEWGAAEKEQEGRRPKSGAGTWEGTKVRLSSENRWKVLMPDPTGLGPAQNAIPPASVPRVDATQRIALQLLNSGKIKDEETATQTAFDIVHNGEQRLMEEARTIAISNKIDPEDKNPDVQAYMQKLVTQLAELKDKDNTSFASDFRYKPKWEHRKTLERTYSPNRPESLEE